MKYVDINCDMGESFGAYTLGRDGEVIRHLTSANVACGFHAGDPLVLGRTVHLARDHGVAVGAHPGFPDLMGFGRRRMNCTPEEIFAYVVYQIGAVRAFCDVHGIALQHVKPHGELYNMAVGNEPITRAIAEAVAAVDRRLILVALAGKHAPHVRQIAMKAGVAVVFEAFPDRAYTADGVLVHRSRPGAVIKDPPTVAERALRMAAEGSVIAEDGSSLALEAETLCVHGDTPTAVDLASHIRQKLEQNDVKVKPMGEIVRLRKA